MKGKNFLKVVGILMIIGGGIGILFSPISVACACAASKLAAELGEEATGMGALALWCIIGVVSSVVELITGIIGVKNCEKPENAGTCFTWGIISVVLCVISFIVECIVSGFGIVSLLLSLVLPVLYIIGALKNKQAA